MQILMYFKKTLAESDRKINKTWVGKGSKFPNISMNCGYKVMILKLTQHIMKKNLLFQKDLLGTLTLKWQKGVN